MGIMIDVDKLSKKIDVNYLYVILTILVCLIIFSIITLTSKHIYWVFSPSVFLTLHFFAELVSILVSFSIFILLYNTFDVFKNVRNIVLAQTFLIVGIFDIFHMLAYEGMPNILINNTLNIGNWFWITARLLMGFGILLSSLISRYKIAKAKKEIFLLCSVCIVLLFFYVINFKTDILPELFVEDIGLTPIKIFLEYVVISLQVVACTFYLREYNKLKDKKVIFFITALCFSIFSELTYALHINVYDIFNLLGHALKIIAYFIMYQIFFLANVKRPYIKLSQVQAELKGYVDNLENIVNQKTKELQETNTKLIYINNKMIEDLEAAKSIQQALLPGEYEDLGEVEFYSQYIPCQRLSGDFFNYFKIDDDNIAVYIVDVSGHGLSAAMVTVFAAQSLKRFHDLYGSQSFEIQSPKEVLKNFYNTFNNSNFPDEVHLVMIYGIYNTKTKVFKYASAGHNCPPVLISKEKGATVLNHSKGFPICKLGEYYKPKYEDFQIKLDKGDRILFYTDGATELKNKKQEIYSPARFISLIQEVSLLDSKKVIDTIKEQLFAYREIDEIEDDITLFVMEVK